MVIYEGTLDKNHKANPLLRIRCLFNKSGKLLATGIEGIRCAQDPTARNTPMNIWSSCAARADAEKLGRSKAF